MTLGYHDYLQYIVQWTGQYLSPSKISGSVTTPFQNNGDVSHTRQTDGVHTLYGPILDPVNILRYYEDSGTDGYTNPVNG